MSTPNGHIAHAPVSEAIRAKAQTFVESWLALPATQSHLVVRDPAAVAAKVAQLLADGPSHLHIISDFDMTMTKYLVNGERGPSSHAVVTRSSTVSKKFRDDTDAMYKKYYPIEIDPAMPRSEKYKVMEQWWTEAHEIIVAERISEADLKTMVAETPMTWRACLHDLMRRTGELDIYFLVFSAGIKNLIKEILAANGLLLPHVHVESNEMFFDPATGIVTHFSEPPIHTLNKSEVVLSDPSLLDPSNTSAEARHARAIQGRNNVLLMGDSLGDAAMADGVEHGVCLRVGFCNHNTDKFLDQFLDAFDVVVLNDVGFDWVQALMALF
ncbi:hypothetical protein H9P43_002564 [Blastocladiella emersonii ATCC 22665]|nr:hypothetical protein H9P43_002564 [Blastocladiella emersonii ATCC 22665]